MTAFTNNLLFKSIFLSTAVACLLSNGVQASTCITAGRMDAGGWAPQFSTVRLLDEAGRLLSVKKKSELAGVRAVELTETALVSVCDGSKPLTRGDGLSPKVLCLLPNLDVSTWWVWAFQSSRPAVNWLNLK